VSLTAGSVLYVCGYWPITASFVVGAHGGNASAHVTITSYVDDPGVIVVSGVGSVFVQNDRPYTIIENLSITNKTSNCLFITAAAHHCVYRYNEFVAVSGSNSCISLYGATGQHHNSVDIIGNRFTGVSNSNGGSALNWFVTTGSNSSLTDVSVLNNVFEELYVPFGRAAIHFRIQNDANSLSKMTRVRVEENIFQYYSGVAVEINSGFATVGQSSGLLVRGNELSYGVESAPGMGGGFALWGFVDDAGWGRSKVSNNNAYNLQGAAGFCNVFFGKYDIYDNNADLLHSTTIDANGVLFDYGTTSSRAFRNRLSSVNGKAGVFNSGSGVMVLDATNVEVFGNVVIGCRVGIFYGNKSGLTVGQSSKVFNNTFLSISASAVYCSSTMDAASNDIFNNVFVGDGLAYELDGGVVSLTSLFNNNLYYRLQPKNETYAPGLNNIRQDPLLKGMQPLVSSPCIGNGLLVRHRDFNKRQLKRSIGAISILEMDIA
jgi:hypothetical protein